MTNKITPIEEQSSESLAARIVVFRVLKIGKEDSIKAMEILQKRKFEGDQFDFINYINEKIKELPKPTIGSDQVQNIKSVLKNVKSGTF